MLYLTVGAFSAIEVWPLRTFSVLDQIRNWQAAYADDVAPESGAVSKRLSSGISNPKEKISRRENIR
jgi:hypothetical protein